MGYYHRKKLWPPEKHDYRYVKGVLLPVYHLGTYTETHYHSGGRPPTTGRSYEAYRPLTNEMSSWVRLEPHDGRRACMMYDPGKSANKTCTPPVSESKELT